jgi:hypothetical protein
MKTKRGRGRGRCWGGGREGRTEGGREARWKVARALRDPRRYCEGEERGGGREGRREGRRGGGREGGEEGGGAEPVKCFLIGSLCIKG